MLLMCEYMVELSEKAMKNKICGMVFGKVEELMRKAEKDGKDVDFLLIGWVILVSLW